MILVAVVGTPVIGVPAVRKCRLGVVRWSGPDNGMLFHPFVRREPYLDLWSVYL